MGNRVKELLRRGELAVGCWLSLPSPEVAELLAALEPDWLLVDTEHGPASWETVEDMIRAMRPTAVVPLVRVAANDPALIKKALDRGAQGVLVPLVHTVDDVRAAVASCRYPPLGIRGVAGTRASRYGLDLDRYFQEWNEQVLVAVQVETRSALDQVEQLARVEGLDLLFVGPNDLSAALGVFRQFDHPEFRKALDRVVQAARSAGIAAGYMATHAEDALARIEQGFQFISLASDARLLLAAARSALSAVRSRRS